MPVPVVSVLERVDCIFVFLIFCKGSYTCTCITGYIGDGVTCLLVPDKPTDVTVTAIDPSEVSVTWNVDNTSMIRHFRVEYKGLGIHGSEWVVIELQPHVTKTYLKDLRPDSTYLVRVGKSRASSKWSRASI